MNTVKDMKETARKQGDMATWNPEEDAGEMKVSITIFMNICTGTVDTIMKNAAAGMNSTMDAMVAIR